MSAPVAPVALERQGPLAIITIDAPPLNLFDEAVIAGLRDCVEALTAQPSRAALIHARGRVVSGGVDVRMFDGLTFEQGTRL